MSDASTSGVLKGLAVRRAHGRWGVANLCAVQPGAMESTRRTDVSWQPEPGRCGGRIDPRQHALPSWLAREVDGHLRPPIDPAVDTVLARCTCPHIDWHLIAQSRSHLFQVPCTSSAPPLDDLWEAEAATAELGHTLIFDVQLVRANASDITDEHVHSHDLPSANLGVLARIHGAGIEGRLRDAAWQSLAPLLTTCGAVLTQPRPDAQWQRRLGRYAPARGPVPDRRPGIGSIAPAGRWAGDWSHTWWAYPDYVVGRAGCTCPAAYHREDDFGPADAST
jgi:hypothetical protein